MFHKETLKDTSGHESSPGVFVAGLVFFCVLVVSLSNLLHNRLGVPYTAYFAYLLFVLAGVYVYRSRFLDYRYILIDDELMFERLVGKREKLMARIKMKEIIAFNAENSPVTFKGNVDKCMHVQLKRHTRETMVLYAKEDGKIIQVFFCPSEALKELIQKRVRP